MTEAVELDRKDLKIQALLEKVSALTTQYENLVADLRVDLTVLSQELEAYRAAAQEPDVEEKKQPKKTSN